ncbi:MAG: hypothetical protein H6619_05355 [Deltaproteobacteria bacterium]|nr:hypothetical protein [Deltaproteobacteria bacterium]
MFDPKSQDERVNGPKIAAQILKNMGNRRKDAIVKRIKARSPKLADKIEENMFSFEDLTDLTPQGMQTLIKEVAHEDIVISFKLASADVQQMFLRNMSERKKDMLQADFEDLGPVRKTDVDLAQRRILEKLDQLRSAGLVLTQGENDIWV